MHVDASEPTRDAVLAAFRAGAYYGEKDGVRLPSDGVLPDALLEQMHHAHARSDRLRAMLKSVKRAADRLGVRVPAGLKAQARRVM